MSKRSRFTIAIFTMWLAMLLAPLANAATGFIEKSCEGVRYFGEVGEEEIVRLQIRLRDEMGGILQQDEIFITSSGPYDVFIPWVIPNPSVNQLNRAAISVSTDGGETFQLLAVDETLLECPPEEPPPEGEGCTPGYWKNHLEDWPPTGLSPNDDFDSIFGVDLFNPDITLDQAVNARGGGVKKLARHGTAALLSALHPDVDYPFTAAAVIALVQAGDVDPLVEANELGCSIP